MNRDPVKCNTIIIVFIPSHPLNGSNTIYTLVTRFERRIEYQKLRVTGNSSNQVIYKVINFKGGALA